MLRTRVITALILLAILLAVVWTGSALLFNAVIVLFFGAALWESARLFKGRAPVVSAVLWSVVLVWLLVRYPGEAAYPLSMLCVAIWAIRLAPALGLGLPPLESFANRLVSVVYGTAIVGCFIAIAALYGRSPLYLLSVMAIVWIADIGAYFSGKAFGRRKLAPSISPGKSWEGAIGGAIAVLVLTSASVYSPALQDTFASHLQRSLGWAGMLVVMLLVVAASVVGDLFESMLKRRAGMKDSSSLLPGHGGVLDRIDALVPVLPLAALIAFRL
ncbi:MAG: phosphatidate cytidylyltransferase [Noviherbaspirillum sp.]